MAEWQESRDERAESGLNLDDLLDIPLLVTVEFGRTRLSIQDLLKIREGSVIELSKLVGEPLDVLVNGQLIARGEVVVVNEKFALRLTETAQPNERFSQAR